MLKEVAVGLYDNWIETSVREVQRAMNASNTISQMSEEFDAVIAKEVDREYLEITYGAKG